MPAWILAVLQLLGGVLGIVKKSEASKESEAEKKDPEKEKEFNDAFDKAAKGDNRDLNNLF